MRYCTLIIFLLLSLYGKGQPDTIQNTMELREPHEVMYENVIIYEGRVYRTVLPSFTRPIKNIMPITEAAIDKPLGAINHSIMNGNTPEGCIGGIFVGGGIYSIKGVDKANYIATPYEANSYAVYCANENKKELAIIKAMEKVWLDAVIAAEEAERAARQYILDNPWPERVIFNGKSYTKVSLGGDNCVLPKELGKQIGETKNEIKAEGAYPKDFIWKDGDATFAVGHPIYEIKGIDPAYYITVVTTVLASDDNHSAKQQKLVKQMIIDRHKLVSEQVAYYQQLRWDGYLDKTQDYLFYAKYPKSPDDKPYIGISIVSVSATVEENARLAIPKGVFEVEFSPKKKIRFYKEENGELVLDKRRFPEMEEQSYNKLFSWLVEGRIERLEERLFTEEHLNTAAELWGMRYITVRYADGAEKRLSSGCFDARLLSALRSIIRQAFD